ncbi:hypothetical protein CPB84DRAFT_1840543 [Gymnopilus junonius]|uniref:Uncharacterized protein n=1 Tax=Gymnopilus junonius TaxID=109634 RepID=A0A9P5TVJ0_GYMJU|nr:hypothetical protein CPB84DRAFT_1840543 [Gymnopilus junonius]
MSQGSSALLLRKVNSVRSNHQNTIFSYCFGLLATVQHNLPTVALKLRPRNAAGVVDTPPSDNVTPNSSLLLSLPPSSPCTDEAELTAAQNTTQPDNFPTAPISSAPSLFSAPTTTTVHQTVLKTKATAPPNSDSDESTIYIQLKTAYIPTKMSNSNLATVEHPVMKNCPILTVGELSAKVLIDLEDAHNDYFIKKDIDDADKVKKILGGFKDVHVHAWITNEHDAYAAFMALL